MNLEVIYPDNVYGCTESDKLQLGAEWKRRMFDIVLSEVAGSVAGGQVFPHQARSIARITNAVDLTKTDKISAETADVEFLKLVFFSENARVAPARARIFCLIQDAITNALDALAPREG